MTSTFSRKSMLGIIAGKI